MEQEVEPVRIVHLSDLHFGAAGYDEVWQSLSDHISNHIKPDLVVVTGDLVETPDRKLFDDVFDELEKLHQNLGHGSADKRKYVVCAGNHDRHKMGNAAPWRRAKRIFEEKFNIPTLINPYDDWLGERPYRWRVRVVAVDSSLHARYSAQAFLDANELKAISDLKGYDNRDEPPHLVLFLLHHHLLPLPATEAKNQSLWSMLRLTSAVNPGTILEKLAESYVDLVLHGHEHKKNLARYASYQHEAGEIAVVAAGSATGAEAFEGCEIRRASFNVLELRSDHSVWIQEWFGAKDENGKTSWAIVPGSKTELLSRLTLRRNRFMRSLHLWRKEARKTGGAGGYLGKPATDKWQQQSEWHKHVTLTKQRHAIVREKRTEWQIANGKFSFRIQNDTGQPAEPEATLEFEETGEEPIMRPLAPLRGYPGTYVFHVDLGTNKWVRAKQIDTLYRWYDSILLTKDDAELIDIYKSGPHRADKREFVAAAVLIPISKLVLTVNFPVGYCPKDAEFDIYYERLRRDAADPLKYLPIGQPVKDEALRPDLECTDQTAVLSLPYPLQDHRYSIVWTPVSARPPTWRALDFQRRAREGFGDSWAKAWLEGLQGAAWGAHATVALYVPTENRMELDQVGFARGPRVAAIPEPAPMHVDLRDRKGAYLHAWWNDSSIVVAESEPLSERERSEGLRMGEIIMATTGFQGWDSNADTPWAVIRVGVMAGWGKMNLRDAENVEGFRIALASGQAQLLNKLTAG